MRVCAMTKPVGSRQELVFQLDVIRIIPNRCGQMGIRLSLYWVSCRRIADHSFGV